MLNPDLYAWNELGISKVLRFKVSVTCVVIMISKFGLHELSEKKKQRLVACAIISLLDLFYDFRSGGVTFQRSVLVIFKNQSSALECSVLGELPGGRFKDRMWSRSV